MNVIYGAWSSSGNEYISWPMKIFKTWFGEKAVDHKLVSFGRFTDAYKTSSQYEHWDAAHALIQDERHLDAIENLLTFLKNRENNNVVWERAPETINFHFYQGSKKIYGFVNDEHLRLEVKVATSRGEQAEWMKKLLELNFNFSYCRYALRDNIVYLTHDIVGFFLHMT